MNMENLRELETKEKLEELKKLGLEAYETTTETMLDEMGASMGTDGCCSIVIKITR